MLNACMGALMELAEGDDRVAYLTADSGEGGLDRIFRMNFPSRAFDFGIAEAAMVSAAAGMAMAGRVPFVYTAAPFLAYRAYEFIRNDVCLQNLNVKLIGTGSGLSVSSLGPTHHATEDLAVLRVLPNLKILSPATPRQVRACMMEAWGHEGPVYVRLGMSGEFECFGDDYAFKPDALEILREGEDAVILTTGILLGEVLEAADRLASEGVGVCVANVHTVKPFDGQGLLELASNGVSVITAEEHSVCGGLGGIVAETFASAGRPVRLCRIGLPDAFSVGYCRDAARLRRENGLDAESILAKVRGILS